MSRLMREEELSEQDQIATEWLVRLGNEALTEIEMNEFAEWIVRDPAHAKAFADAEDFMASMSDSARQLIPRKSVCKPGSGFSTVGYRAKNYTQKRSPSHKKHWLALPLVAAAVWLFAVNLIVPQQAHLLDAYFSDYSTGTGELKAFELSDGSQLLLNTNSSVSVNFQNQRRQIVLHHGEVRFVVANDPSRPFEVVAENTLFRAMGTVFDVRVSDSGDVDLTVEEHAVLASLNRNDFTQETETDSRLVREGQRLSIVPRTKLPLPETEDIKRATAWQRRLLVIDNQPLSKLIDELSRYRKGRIFLNDPALNELRFSGVFPLDDVNTALESVRKVLGLRVSRVGDWWVILHR